MSVTWRTQLGNKVIYGGGRGRYFCTNCLFGTCSQGLKLAFLGVAVKRDSTYMYGSVYCIATTTCMHYVLFTRGEIDELHIHLLKLAGSFEGRASPQCHAPLVEGG